MKCCVGWEGRGIQGEREKDREGGREGRGGGRE